jgi:hypothetical protein
VHERIDASRYGFGLVTSAGGVVLGRLRRSALDCDPTARIEDVMEPGPSTVRPHTPAAKLAKRLAARDLKTAIVTTPEGVLLGVVREALRGRHGDEGRGRRGAGARRLRFHQPLLVMRDAKIIQLGGISRIRPRVTARATQRPRWIVGAAVAW